MLNRIFVRWFFLNRYRFLLQGQKISTHLLPNDVSATILKTQGTQYVDQYRIGATKVSQDTCVTKKYKEK
jgi:hypothetical protein